MGWRTGEWVVQGGSASGEQRDSSRTAVHTPLCIIHSRCGTYREVATELTLQPQRGVERESSSVHQTRNLLDSEGMPDTVLRAEVSRNA